MQAFVHGYTWKTAEDLQGLRISSAYEHYTLPPKNSRNYNLPTWTLLSVYQGKCIHSSSPQGKTYPQAPLQVLLHPPNTNRYEHRLRENMIHAAYILFYDSENSPLKQLFIDIHRWIIFDEDKNKTLGSLIKELVAVGSRDGETGFWNAQAILCRIYGLLIASQSIGEGRYNIAISGNMEKRCLTSLSQRVDAYLQRKIDHSVTLKIMAEELGVSVSTLTHRYQAETGISPIKVLAKKRLDRIKMFLKIGYSVKFIVRQMSFPDSSALSKFFKQNMGISPRDFLQRHNHSR